MSSDSPTPSPTLLISDLPPKTLVGIDLLSFNSAPNFHGIKDLPPGAHFVYTGTTADFSLRSGEWFFIPDNSALGLSSADIQLRKWNTELESLVPVNEGSDDGRQEAMQRRANLGRIWRAGGLLSYGSQLDEGDQTQGEQEGEESAEDTVAPARKDWQRLTNYITPAVLNRILGPGEPGAEQIPRWTVTSGSSAACDTDNIPGISGAEAASAGGVAGEQERDLRFIPINLKMSWREGAIGRERTEAARDKSWALGEFVDRYNADAQTSATPDATGLQPGELQCLGEMQLTFLMVLTLMNFSCLEQWKRLLGLLFSCRAAIIARERFYIKVLQLLRIQLAHCDDVEGGLFEMDGDDGGALLKKLLTGFCKTVDEVIGERQSGVKSDLEKLEQWANKKYGWELRRGFIVRRGMLELEDGERVEMDMSGAEEEDEAGEYAPVVVDLNNPEGSDDVDDDVGMLDTPSH